MKKENESAFAWFFNEFLGKTIKILGLFGISQEAILQIEAVYIALKPNSKQSSTAFHRLSFTRE